MEIEYNIKVNSNFLPDLEAKLIPGVCAGGIYIGSSGKELIEKIGPIKWYERESISRNAYTNNEYWFGSISRSIDDNNIFQKTLTYKNNLLSFTICEKNDIIHNVTVNEGYKGKFIDVGIGDNITKLNKYFEIKFEDTEDWYYLGNKNEYELDIYGIYFGASAPDYSDVLDKKKIVTILISNWTLQGLPMGLNG